MIWLRPKCKSKREWENKMKNKKFITQKVFVQEHSGFHHWKEKKYKTYLGCESQFRAKKGKPLFFLTLKKPIKLSTY